MEFKEITTREQMAEFLGVSLKFFTSILYGHKVDSYYKIFFIPKKSGGVRCIHAPTGDLKILQRRLSNKLYEYQAKIWKEENIHPNISHGFERGKGIITNAEVHKHKRYIINFDLENFFDQFNFGRVCGYFEKNRDFQIPHDMAAALTQLVCYQRKLPQGAPCSPVITNFMCQIYDMRLLKLAKKYRLDYTRYADDLTFSTNDKKILDRMEDFFREVHAITEKAGFHINESKTHVQYKDSRQMVTGLVVNQKISVPYTYYKKARAMADCLYRTGEFKIDGKTGTLNQLEGIFAYISYIDHVNTEKNKFPYFTQLSGRDRQYQKFLFYRYFYASPMPIIMTEGKTDIVYLECALKSLYQEYPTLVQREEDGKGEEKFSFKFQFFKRTDRFGKFFGIAKDGADTMKKFYGFFMEKGKDYPDLMNQLLNSGGPKPSNPIIMVFDNETKTGKKKKPLAEFMGTIKAKEKQTRELQDHLGMCIRENLFLVTNPLADGKEECEIEDLFLPEVLETELGGKKFSREDKIDTEHSYGKDIFSKYIQQNYKTIDFSRFRPLLNAIAKIVEDYQKDK